VVALVSGFAAGLHLIGTHYGIVALLAVGFVTWAALKAFNDAVGAPPPTDWTGRR
jgi:hypothetical protein